MSSTNGERSAWVAGEAIEFADQDDLVERAVAWLCSSSATVGQDADGWVATIDGVIAFLQGHRYAVVTRGKGVRGRDDAVVAVADGRVTA